MKRIIAVTLALLLIGCAALAQPDDFPLKDGIDWNMSESQVRAVEGDAEYQVINGDVGRYVRIEGMLEDIPFIREYCFRADRLVAVRSDYDFSDTRYAAYIAEWALEDAYGETCESDYDRWNRLETTLDGEDHGYDPAFLFCWEPGDGSFVVMGTDASDRIVRIRFFNEDALLTGDAAP